MSSLCDKVVIIAGGRVIAQGAPDELRVQTGAASLEATVQDGRGTVTAVFLGRRKIPGMSPGRRVMLAGVAGKDGNRYLVYNPEYQLLG